MENCFAFHREKRSSSERKNALEAKIGALEERFKSLASFGQIFDSPCSFGAQASTCTLDCFMFGTSGEVISSATVTRVQTVLRATPLITEKFMDNL